MTKRYFKATDGKVTVFRSSEERVYRAASFKTKPDGRIFGIGFSSGSGSYETVEITQAEYESLVARKMARVRASGATARGAGSSPQDSWISNASLAA